MDRNDFLDRVKARRDTPHAELDGWQIAAELALHIAEGDRVHGSRWMDGDRDRGERVLMIVTGKSFVIVRFEGVPKELVVESVSITKLRSVETRAWGESGGRVVLKFASGVFDDGGYNSQVVFIDEENWPSPETAAFLRGLSMARR